MAPDQASPVIVQKTRPVQSIMLNRPEALNSLFYEMVDQIREAVEEARADESVRLLLFYGLGDRGFCAGGDVKAMARDVREGRVDRVLHFLSQEYALDLSLHRFPKPVAVIADGITMGGGLGLAAGADIVVATERTRMAMPETRIGFFPDVGATGWLFEKCPPGYPEFLGLTGYEAIGGECVRLGLATHLVQARDLPMILENLTHPPTRLDPDNTRAVEQINTGLEPFTVKGIPIQPEMDAWVRTYLDGRDSVPDLLEDLRQCGLFSDLCRGIFQRLSERSPTALAVTLKLLSRNRGRPLEEVFAADLQAARFLLNHPDYLEGVRARLLDKDDRPRWQPDRLEEVGDIRLEL
ncbi:MAG: enoyl-CoA hydratase/isomerase family protein [Deltaproteobacteria bacterium]|nr:enoyl-CoA hydratase/isomerase family protein [Deltaproteobacteria bacterium]